MLVAVFVLNVSVKGVVSCFVVRSNFSGAKNRVLNLLFTLCMVIWLSTFLVCVYSMIGRVMS